MEPDDQTINAFVQSHQSGGTLEEVAALWGVTRERIRQIEACAVAKIKRKLAARSIHGMRDIAPESYGSTTWKVD